MRRVVILACAIAALALAGCSNDPAPGGPENGSPDNGSTTPSGNEPSGNEPASGGSGCGVISVAQVSDILGEPYVEEPTDIEGAGPDGSYTEDGVSGFSCLFSPADGDVHDLSITTFANSSEMYELMLEGEGGTPVDGLGRRAQLFRDEIEVMVIAEGNDQTVAVVVLTNLDGSPVEDQVVEITRIVLGA